eukprot:gene10555-30280_t
MQIVLKRARRSGGTGYEPMGAGNSAFETANDMAPHVNYVHVVPGRLKPGFDGPDRHEFSRYVGNLRALNAGLLDAYLLKSLDGFSITPTMDKYVMVKCGKGRNKICLFRKGAPLKQRRAKKTKGEMDESGAPPPIQMVELGLYSVRDRWAVNLVEKLRSEGVAVVTYDVQTSDSKLLLGAAEANLNYDDNEAEEGPEALSSGAKPAQTLGDGFLSVKSKTVAVDAALLSNETLVDMLTELARRSGTPHPLVYDKVVRCLGWKHDHSPYASDTEPLMQPNGKYAVMTSEYESVNVPGMYFAGTLSHGKDWLRSAGGFIHGFRYTSRALFRILEAKRANGKGGVAGNNWPATAVFPLVEVWDGTAILRAVQTPFTGFLDKLFDRINTASGPYQMVAVLGDGVVFQCSSPDAAADAKARQPPTVTAEYLEEIPVSYFNKRYAGRPRLIWHFGYEQQRQSLHDSRRKGTLFQVHIWWHSGDCNDGSSRSSGGGDAEYKEVLRIGEDLNTNWGAYETRVRVGEWIYTKVAELRKAPTHNADVAREAAVALAAKQAQEQADRKAGAAKVLRDVKERRKSHAASCSAGAETNPECVIARKRLESSQAAAMTFMKNPPQQSSTGAGASSSQQHPLQSPRKRVDVSTMLPKDVADGHGDIPESEPWEEELQRCNSAGAWKVYGDAGDAGGYSRKQVICALQLGRRWPGGRVELNVVNNCNTTVSLWHGTKLYFNPPAMVARALLAPGEGARYVSHEKELWSIRGGDAAEHAALEVDLANGIVQDFILRGDGEHASNVCATIVEVSVSSLRLGVGDEELL